MSMETPQDGPDGPFAALLGIRPGQSADGVGTAFMTVADQHRQRAGVVQGGILVALADYAFFRACRSVLKPGEHAVTIELKLNFIAPARDGELTARSVIKSRGGRIIVADYGDPGTRRRAARRRHRHLYDGLRPPRRRGKQYAGGCQRRPVAALTPLPGCRIILPSHRRIRRRKP